MSDEPERNEDVIDWESCPGIVGDLTFSDGVIGRYYRFDRALTEDEQRRLMQYDAAKSEGRTS